MVSYARILILVCNICMFQGYKDNLFLLIFQLFLSL